MQTALSLKRLNKLSLLDDKFNPENLHKKCIYNLRIYVF